MSSHSMYINETYTYVMGYVEYTSLLELFVMGKGDQSMSMQN